MNDETRECVEAVAIEYRTAIERWNGEVSGRQRLELGARFEMHAAHEIGGEELLAQIIHHLLDEAGRDGCLADLHDADWNGRRLDFKVTDRWETGSVPPHKVDPTVTYVFGRRERDGTFTTHGWMTGEELVRPESRKAGVPWLVPLVERLHPIEELRRVIINESS